MMIVRRFYHWKKSFDKTDEKEGGEKNGIKIE